MSVSGTVKSIQDIMRKDAGVDGDAQRISQLGWMLFLKICGDQDQERELFDKSYNSPIPEPYRWSNWAADDEGITGEALLNFINNDLFPALKGLPSEGANGRRGAVVRNVFEDAYNYMKNGTLVRQVANKINEIDFNSTEDRHLFGDIYEQILKDLQSAGNAGEFYTPRAVTQFMVDMVDPKLGETMMDPACGTGGFLTCTIEHVREKYVNSVEDEETLQASLLGVEKKPLPHLLCVTNMLLHGIDMPSFIRHDNTLARPYRDYGPSDRIDIILTNPPFGGKEEDGIESNFPAEYRTKETADLFLVLINRLLQTDGRGAVILPNGSLFGTGVQARIRKMFLRECNLHTIIRMPNGVFAPYTPIPTNILFFERPGPTKEIWYYEHPLPEDRKNYTKTKPLRLAEFNPCKEWWSQREQNLHAWKVSVEEISNAGYDLDQRNPSATLEIDDRRPQEVIDEILKTENRIIELLADIEGVLEQES